MKKVALLLSLGMLLTVSCAKKEQEAQVSNVSFTICQQTKSTKSEVSDKVDVEFTKEGVKITYCNFGVTCDFTTVNVTHTLVNGFLNITQQGLPNQAKCVCYTDVSYTITGISKNEVNVIFINGRQVYCHNDSGNDGGEVEEPCDKDVSGVYIAGSWDNPENITTKSASGGYPLVTWREMMPDALTSGNLLHLIEKLSSQNENRMIKSYTDGVLVASMWKNGDMQPLDTYWSRAYSVYVTDCDVYVAGTVGSSTGRATIWKNGIAQYLTPDAICNADIGSVYVSNGDVYVAGSEWSYDKQTYIAKLWKNGIAQNLSSGATWMAVTSLSVSGSDVYVAGFEIPDRNKGIGIAKLWKNGQEQNLTDGTICSSALSVYVSGNDVYVAGFEGNTARLWKNGVVQNLSNGATVASTVFVSGGDVYVAGYDVDVPDMKIWKNGNVLYRMAGKYYVKSIFVSGSDVYVVANETTFQNTAISTAKLWKNGVLHDISNNSTRSEANCVFVK